MAAVKQVVAAVAIVDPAIPRSDRVTRGAAAGANGITRVEAEKATAPSALIENPAQLRRIFDTLTEGIMLWRGDGRLVYANPAAQSLCGPLARFPGPIHIAEFFSHLRDADGAPLGFSRDPLQMITQQPQKVADLLVHLPPADEGICWLRLGCAALRDPGTGQVVGAATSLTDVSKLQQRNERMVRLATHDPLTDLPNRNLLQDRIQQALAHNRRAGTQLAVCYLDLDGFKAVNDRLGHDRGDELLARAARRMRSAVRTDDTVARLGGDEFVLLIGGLESRWDCEPVIKRLLQNVARPFRFGNGRGTSASASVSASLGVAMYPTDGSDAEVLLRNADHAMYAAKHSGKNGHHWFRVEHENRLEADQQALDELAHGLLKGQIAPYYQAIVDCRSGVLLGAAVEPCWQHPVLGVLPAAQFLPLAAGSEIGERLAEQFLQQALRQVRRWRVKGFDVMLDVTLSAEQLQQAGFTDRLAGLLSAECGEDKPGIRLAVAEKTLVEDFAGLAGSMRNCRRLGVACVLTGFSAAQATLDHLLGVPLVAAKIEPGLVRGLPHDVESRTRFDAIAALARSLGLGLIADGVTCREQVDYLRRADCHAMQGGHLARPMAADEFRVWAQTSTRRSVLPPNKDQDDAAASTAVTGV